MTQNPDNPDNKDRKERVLHTRVPAVLEEELKRLAEALRLPVSNLVRTILEDAISAVDVVGKRADRELRGVAERLAAERDRLRGGLERWQRAAPVEPAVAAPEPTLAAEKRGEVLGWHPLILATARACARCGRRLEAGTSAYLGLSANGQPAEDGGLVIGTECLQAREQSDGRDHD